MYFIAWHLPALQILAINKDVLNRGGIREKISLFWTASAGFHFMNLKWLAMRLPFPVSLSCSDPFSWVFPNQHPIYRQQAGGGVTERVKKQTQGEGKVWPDKPTLGEKLWLWFREH